MNDTIVRIIKDYNKYMGAYDWRNYDIKKKDLFETP